MATSSPAWYFVAKSDEDGTSIEGPFTAEALEKKLGENYWGEVDYWDHLPESDSGHWLASAGTMVIIKGEIVVPEEVQVVRRVKLP